MATQTDLSPHTCIDDYALARIDYRVGRLAQVFHLGEEQAEDLQQEMAAELLKAAVRYDPSRSCRKTFINRTLDRYYRHVARGLRNHRKHEALRPIPFSAMKNFRPVTNDPGKGELSEQQRADLRSDVACVLAALPARLRPIGEALMLDTPREAAERLGLHRSTIYRAISEMRHHFIAAGLGGAA